MAHILILADHDSQFDRVTKALNGWGTDVVLSSADAGQLELTEYGGDATWDVVLLDHGEPVELRLLAVREIQRVNRAAKILVTNIPPEGDEGRKALIFQYLEDGAAGYVASDKLDTELTAAIESVLSDGAWIEPAMKIELIQRTVELHDALTMLRPYSAASGPANVLTRRQHEVLELLAAGHTNKEIADELYISVGTVKNHVHRILDVLRASSREQAAQYYQFLQEPSATAG